MSLIERWKSPSRCSSFFCRRSISSLNLRERRGVLLACLHVLGEPAGAGLVLREGGDEVLARHAGIAHRDDHDLLLELANLRDMGAQVEDQRIEHPRRELELHEFIGGFLARLQRLRVTRAVLLDPGENVHIGLRQAGEARCGLLWIRSGVDGFLFAVGAVLPFFLVLGLLLFRGHFHLGRVLRLRDHVRRIGVDEADDDIDEARLADLHRLVGFEQEVVGGRIERKRTAHGLKSFLDAPRDADLALAREELHRPHLTHVHAHRIGSAAELRIERCERGGGFFDRFLVGGGGRLTGKQRLGIRRLFVDRNSHVVDGVDDVLDLLRIDDLRRQVVVDLRVGEVALLLAAGDEQLQLRLTIFRHDRCAALQTQWALIRGVSGITRDPPCEQHGASPPRGAGAVPAAFLCVGADFP